MENASDTWNKFSSQRIDKEHEEGFFLSLNEPWMNVTSNLVEIRTVFAFSP